MKRAYVGANEEYVEYTSENATDIKNIKAVVELAQLGDLDITIESNITNQDDFASIEIHDDDSPVLDQFFESRGS